MAGIELEGDNDDAANLANGDFHLEFVSISRVINHMTCYKFKCSHWGEENLFSKKSLARFSLQSECCNFNQ